jgi:hypothetical protein
MANAVFANGIVGGGTAQNGNAFTLNGNGYVSGSHYVSTNSTTIGSHVVGGASAQPGYIFTATGNSYVSADHFVGGNSNTSGTHRMGSGISGTSHYVGSGSLVAGNAFGVNGNAYTSGTHAMDKGISGSSHYVGLGSLVAGNAFGVNGNAYTSGTHVMDKGISGSSHYIGAAGTTVGSNVLVANGSAYTVNTHTMGYGVTSGTHVIGGSAAQVNHALTVTGNSYTSGNHNIVGTANMGTALFTTGVVGGGAAQAGNALTTNGNLYVSTNQVVGGVSVIGGGAAQSGYVLTANGNGYVNGSHLVVGTANVGNIVTPGNANITGYHTIGSWATVGGFTQVTNNAFGVTGNSYTSVNHTVGGNSTTSGVHTISGAGNALSVVNNIDIGGTAFLKTSVSSTSHYVGTGTLPAGNAFGVNGNSYVANNHIIGGAGVVGGTTAQAGNALTVTGNSFTSNNHFVAGNTSVGGTHAILVTNPYAAPAGTGSGITGATATWSSGTVTLTFNQQPLLGVATIPFTVGQIITIAGLTPAVLNGNVTVVGTPTTTQVSYALASNPGTITGTATITHQSSLSVQGIVTVQGNASIGNITAVSSITGQVITLSGNTNSTALLASGIVRIGGNHTIAGTHTVGSTGVQATNYTFNGAGLGVTINFNQQAVTPFTPGQLLILTGFSALNNIDYTVHAATQTSVTIGRSGVGTVIASDPGWYGFGSGTQISISPNNVSMNLNGGASVTGNISLGSGAVTLYNNGSISTTNGTFTAKLFSGNGASITNLDYSAITTNKPNTTSVTQAAAGGGAFSYSTTTGFSFTPAAIPTYTTQTLGASGSGGLSLSGTTFSYTPPVIPAAYVLPAATTTSLGGVRISTGLSVSSGILTNNGVVSLSAGTGTSVTNTAGGASVVNIGQAVGTGNDVQFNKVTAGSATTATVTLFSYGAISSNDNITAYATSDIKFKENVRPIPNALEKVLSIGGKLFDWTDEYLNARGGEDGYFYRKADFGVIANDVLKYFPEASRTKEDGTLAVDYEKLAALSFQAIAEQEEKHKQDIKSLQDQIDSIMNLLKDKQ